MVARGKPGDRCLPVSESDSCMPKPANCELLPQEPQSWLPQGQKGPQGSPLLDS